METEEHKNRQNGLMTFTLFVILPTEDVCSLRNLTSGVTIRELRCRLELMAGIPAQIYRLLCSDEVALHEEHQLILERNVWDGFIVRIQLHESWLKLYKAVLSNNIDFVINHGAVHIKDKKLTLSEEESNFKNTVRERGFVALFMASYHGHIKMCQMLISLGAEVNMRTPFNRTPLHAAVCRDQDRVMDVLVQHGGSIDVKDVIGDSAEIVARKCFAKECIRKLRIMKLQGSNGILSVPGSAVGGRRQKGSFTPAPPVVPLPDRPAPSSRSRLAKRHTVGCIGSETPAGQEVTSFEYFMWNTDTPRSRNSSDPKLRQGVTTANNMPRLSTADSKLSVTFGDSSSRRLSGQTPGRHKQFQNQTSILKNKDNNWATIPPRKSQSRGASSLVPIRVPPPAPSEHGSQLSVASAPGLGLDSSGGNSDTRSVESAPDIQAQSFGDMATGGRPETSRKQSPKRPRGRLLVSRHRTNESWRTMKRRIQMAESKKKLIEENRQKKRETFEEWLNRKRKEGKRDCRESDSEESESDTEGGNSDAFKEWLKEQRDRRIVRPQTVTVADLYRRQTRPLKGLVTVTDPPEVNLDTNENMIAHKKWREKYNSVGEYEESRAITTQKKKLEEKRQQLLARAVSYDEWMEHTEDRKKLMQRILQANMTELGRIETERFKKRTPKQITYTQWRESTEKKEAERKFRERQRTQKEEEQAARDQFRSSASVPHDEWMKRKEEEKSQKLKKERQKENLQDMQGKRGHKASAFDEWFEKKHQHDLVEIQSQIQREREMIKVLRDRRGPSVSTC